MSTIAPADSPGAVAHDRKTVAEAARGWWQGVRGGELGSLPIIIGLIIIAVVFQSQNSNFLTSGNFVNLIVQAAAYMTIGMGVVFVLLLGEIDLSIGFVSGVAGVLTALLLLDDGNQLGAIPAIIIAVGAGAAIGTLHGLLITKVGIPSFVVTLAGLLGWQGVVLLLIGDRGTVTLQNSTVVGFANDFLPAATSWIVLIACVGVYAVTQISARMSRAKAGLPTEPDVLIVARVAVLLVIGAVIVAVANDDRGIPYVFLVLAVLYLLWTFVLARTKFGRYVYATGGNAEAARLGGVRINTVRVATFALSGAAAALAGSLDASRVLSAQASTGSFLTFTVLTGIIVGGTSILGGEGSVPRTVLGCLFVALVANGFNLLGLDPFYQQITLGIILLLAVGTDAWSRRQD